MDKDEIVTYWKSSSLGDFELAHSLYESKRYVYCLFFIHLSIEKLLKGLIADKTTSPVPYEHNLVRLSGAAGIAFSEEQLDLLTDMTAFNIKARYDDYKNQFAKVATREYTEKYLLQADQFILWLKTHFRKI